MSVQSQSTRHIACATPEKIAARVGDALVGWLKEHGYSERELCMRAEVDRRTWRRSTGRPYPSDRGGVSFLTLRDFIAVANVLHLDPAEILADVLRTVQ